MGRVANGDTPLPGASITALVGEKVVALTSTDIDGTYAVPLAPGTYGIKVELTAFVPVQREVTVGQPPCDVETNLALVLISRAPADMIASAPKSSSPVTQIATPPPAATSAIPARTGGAGTPPVVQQAQGRGGRQGGPPRFQTLSVQQSTSGNEATVDLTPADRANDPAARLLPPGFSLDATGESVTVNGTMVELDRNQLNDRLQALGRGEFGVGEGQFGQPGQLAQGIGGAAGAPGQGGGGRGGSDAGGRGGGGFGPGGLGGRAGGANRLQLSANYSLGSSLFDAAPYPLRNQAQPKRDYLQQTAGFTLGGPVKIPHIYNGSTRTTFNLTYSSGRNGNLFDQYATVPSAAIRRGDFSSSPIPIIDPSTGQPFLNNQIPGYRISPAAQALLQFIPSPTLEGDTRNFRNTGTSSSNTDQVTLRITHSLTKPPAGRGGRGGGGAGRGGQPGQTGQTGAQAGRSAQPAPAGPSAAPAPGSTPTAQATPAGPAPPAGPAAATPTTGGAQGRQGGAGQGGRGGRGNFQPPFQATMNATINYRRNDGDRLNVFPLLNGTTKGSTWSVPVTVNIRAGRSMHAVNFNFSRTSSSTLNGFAFNQNIAGDAGIRGVATDPFDWGVPSISFGSYTALRDVTPSKRIDRSFQAGYGLTRTAGKHNFRIGASYQQQNNRTQSDSNPNGSFTFTGLYTAGGLKTTKGSGQDFADFLLGLPQQATRQYSLTTDNVSTPIEIRGRQASAYFQDDWRWKARWTINLGLQYDYVAPFTELNGHMVNLDAAPAFVAVAPVESGEIGPYSGEFPAALVFADGNNVAPRIGAAWRATNRSVVRFGYGLTYNSGTYSNVARQLYQEPPFFLTGTSLGSLAAPLTLADPFANITPSTITNSYGIDKNYQLGLIHQWTADYSRDLFKTWNVGATYFGTLGRHLDLLRAPNRTASGLRIAGVQSFTWQSSDGASHANGLSLRLQKRQTKGVSGQVSYTLATSRDNTTATSGNATVAQDDQNLAAEWARSNFDQRHQVSGSVSVQLPWGLNRHWLNHGGFLSAVVGDWSMNANLTWQSGTPLTVRCTSCASEVARGTGGTLRADYTGLPIQLSNPTIDQFVNTAAFTIPVPGTFGNSFRNMIVGPGSRLLNANFSRDVRLGGNRAVTIQATANNLLNMVNYTGIDTNINSPTFGQVTSVRPMRSVRLNLRFRF